MSASSLSLSCPAQGAPVPAYRPVTHQLLPRARWRINPKISFGDNCQPGQTCLFLFGSLLPSPGCPRPRLQASPKNLSLEPVGGSAPKFSALASSSTVAMPSKLPFSLSCPAQGSPVPAYRFVVCQEYHCRACWRVSSQILGGTNNQRTCKGFQSSLQPLLSSSRVSCTLL